MYSQYHKITHRPLHQEQGGQTHSLDIGLSRGCTGTPAGLSTASSCCHDPDCLVGKLWSQGHVHVHVSAHLCRAKDLPGFAWPRGFQCEFLGL